MKFCSKKIGFSIAILIASTFIFLSCKEETSKTPEIFLSLQLEKGQKFMQEMESSNVGDYILYGQKMNIQQDYTSVIETIIDSVKENSFKTLNQYKHQKLGFKISRDGTVESYYFDTAKPDSGNLPNEKMRPYLIKLLKLPFSNSLNKNGKITQTNIWQVITNAGGIDFQEGNLSMFTIGVTYPEYALKKGEKWIIEINDKDSLGYAEGFYTYTLINWTATTATIGMSSEYKYSFYEPTKIENKRVNQNGTYVVFRNSGWIKSGNIEETDITTTTNKDISEIIVKSRITLKNKVL
jgi:hypothetical protein